MARKGTYPLLSAVDGTAQLFSSRRLVTVVPREMDRLWAQLAAPSVTFVRGPPRDDQALQAWAQLWPMGKCRQRASSLRPWCAWRPRPTPRRTRSSGVRNARSPTSGGGITCRSCPVVLAAALTGFRAMCALLLSRGYAVCWRDSLGARVYDKAGRTTQWRLARDEDVVVQSVSAAWDVAITWSELTWAPPS